MVNNGMPQSPFYAAQNRSSHDGSKQIRIKSKATSRSKSKSRKSPTNASMKS